MYGKLKHAFITKLNSYVDKISPEKLKLDKSHNESAKNPQIKDHESKISSK